MRSVKSYSKILTAIVLAAAVAASPAGAQSLLIDDFESAGPGGGDANGIIGDPINVFPGNAGEWVSFFARPSSMVTMEQNANVAYVSQGTKSLRINQVGDSAAGAGTHYDRPAVVAVNNPAPTGDPWVDFIIQRYENFETVGANPGNYNLEFDVIVDPALIPPPITAQTENEFLQVGVFSNSGGVFLQGTNDAVFLDAGVLGDLRDAGEPATFSASVPAADMRFDFETPPTTHQLGFSLNGWWDAQRGGGNDRAVLVGNSPTHDPEVNPRPATAHVNAATGEFNSVTSYKYGDGLVSGKHRVALAALDEAGNELKRFPPEYSDIADSPLIIDAADAPLHIKVPKS